MHLTLTRYGFTSVMITRTDGSEGMPYTLLKAIESIPGVEAASFQEVRTVWLQYCGRLLVLLKMPPQPGSR